MPPPSTVSFEFPSNDAVYVFRLHSGRVLTTMRADTYQTRYVPEPSPWPGRCQLRLRQRRRRDRGAAHVTNFQPSALFGRPLRRDVALVPNGARAWIRGCVSPSSVLHINSMDRYSQMILSGEISVVNNIIKLSMR